jgi:alpha-D-ribose 1-methylphosphonate 5-triphosphate synthase subunit PhnH
MLLDPIHDIQRAYRELVTAMAFPGTVCDLSPYAAKLTDDCGIAAMPLLLGLTLLDAEVSFSLYAGAEAAAIGGAGVLSEMTGSPAVPQGAPAPYLFILGAETPVSEAFASAPIGTLENPHRGATMLLEVNALGKTGTDIELTGPGIAKRQTLTVDRAPDWIGARSEKNREYPLGVDLLLYDAAGHVAAIPRTTNLEQAG